MNPEYLLFPSKPKGDEKPALLIYLHGAGGVGDDVRRLQGQARALLEGIKKFNEMQDAYFKHDGNNRPYFLFEEDKVLYWDNQEEEKSIIEPVIYNLGGWDQTPLYDVSLGLTWDMYEDEGGIA